MVTGFEYDQQQIDKAIAHNLKALNESINRLIDAVHDMTNEMKMKQ